MFVVTALVIVFGALAGFQVRFLLRRRRLQRKTWEDLLLEMQPVNVSGIAEIAENFLRPSRRQLRIEPSAMWASVGKWDGIKTLRDNAELMLDLAAFTEQWDRKEGRIVGEMIRRDGVRLKSAVSKIELAMVLGAYETLAPFQLQEAIAAYYLMRGRLLALYEAIDADHYQRLAAAI